MDLQKAIKVSQDFFDIFCGAFASEMRKINLDTWLIDFIIKKYENTAWDIWSSWPILRIFLNVCREICGNRIKIRCRSFLWKKPSCNKVLNFFKGEINVMKNYFKWGGVGKVCERVVSSVSRARKEIGRKFPGRGRGYCIIKIRIAKERIISWKGMEV